MLPTWLAGEDLLATGFRCFPSFLEKVLCEVDREGSFRPTDCFETVAARERSCGESCCERNADTLSREAVKGVARKSSRKKDTKRAQEFRQRGRFERERYIYTPPPYYYNTYLYYYYYYYLLLLLLPTLPTYYYYYYYYYPYYYYYLLLLLLVVDSETESFNRGERLRSVWASVCEVTTQKMAVPKSHPSIHTQLTVFVPEPP